MDLKFLRTKLSELRGKQKEVKRNIKDIETSLLKLKRNLTRYEQAQEIIREVGIATQQQLTFHISDVVSLALETVFDDPYEFEVEFVRRRGKSECDLFFVRDGQKIHPLTASGGGAVDVASFALRVASWSMQIPRKNNVLILDEPFKNLSAEYLPYASELLKKLSEKLNLQIIMVSHSEELIDYADKVFVCSIRNGVSKVAEK